MNLKVDGPGELDRNGNYLGRTQRYSFGVSRDRMKKLYVDAITKEGNDSPKPGPGFYTLSPTLGPESKSGLRYSMAPKNDLFVKQLEK
jgi:hypothetical protein